VAQPIRIDDAVIVENESGRIEEITLNYVVVRLWDWRRISGLIFSRKSRCTFSAARYFAPPRWPAIYASRPVVGQYSETRLPSSSLLSVRMVLRIKVRQRQYVLG
jgi:hypothetical protein